MQSLRLTVTNPGVLTNAVCCRGQASVLQIGTREQPFEHKAVITLHGRRDTAREIPVYGAKNIAVRYGTLDMHGMPKTPTWTKLSATVDPAASVITLAESVNWEVGDEIAIASSWWGPEQSEKRTIVSIANGITVTLDKPLMYRHLGEIAVRCHLLPELYLCHCVPEL